jgi:predicted AlkP superfamily pyrophosphatase or phosphodiesterase
MVRGPTLYDAVHQHGLTTAQVDWVAIQHAPTITWAFPERPEAADLIPAEMVKAGIMSQADVDSFATRNIVWRDEIWTKAAEYILRQHRPNLLMFHLLNLDSTQHRYGPRTPAAMTTMAHLDAQVARIVRTIEQTGLASRTTIFVVSDHGFKQVKRLIRVNAAFLAAGLIKAQDGKVTQADAYVVPEGGTGIVYVTVPDPNGEILARARKAMTGVEGIDTVIEPADYHRYGLPLPEENNQMGALFVTAKEGYAFAAPVTEPVVSDAVEGSLGTHGYLSTDSDLGALFIASGAGIKRGVVLDAIDNLDVAPTAARLLGVALPNVEGKVLEDVLARPRR